MLRSPIICGFIEEFGTFGEHYETMSEALRYPELRFVLRAKVHADPLAKCSRASAEVDGNVEHLTVCNPYQLPLGLLNLIVQTAKHAFDRPRVVILNKLYGSSNRFLENLLIEAFVEKAALVPENLRLKENNIRDVEWGGFQFWVSPICNQGRDGRRCW